MEKPNRQEEEEARKKKAMDEHKRLHKLFVEDRLCFEREKRRMINEVINRAGNEEERQKLRALQDSWDRRMRGAGSAHNRLVLAQTFFWEHFHEKWQPTIQRLNITLNGSKGSERT